MEIADGAIFLLHMWFCSLRSVGELKQSCCTYIIMISYNCTQEGRFVSVAGLVAVLNVGWILGRVLNLHLESFFSHCEYDLVSITMSRTVSHKCTCL